MGYFSLPCFAGVRRNTWLLNFSDSSISILSCHYEKVHSSDKVQHLICQVLGKCREHLTFQFQELVSISSMKSQAHWYQQIFIKCQHLPSQDDMTKSAKDGATLYYYMYIKKYAYFNGFIEKGQEDGFSKKR